MCTIKPKIELVFGSYVQSTFIFVAQSNGEEGVLGSKPDLLDVCCLVVSAT